MKNNVPPKGSSQWRKNEKIIAKNPLLRAARDKAEGFKPGSGISSAETSEEYKANYDKIKWGKKLDTNKSYRVKVNGVYLDEDNDV
jgi:hypothetical protein